MRFFFRFMRCQLIDLPKHRAFFFSLSKRHLPFDAGPTCQQGAGQKRQDAHVCDEKTGVMQFIRPTAQRRAEDINGHESEEPVEPSGVIKKPLHERSAVSGLHQRRRGQDGDKRREENEGEGKRADDFDQIFHGTHTLSEIYGDIASRDPPPIKPCEISFYPID